MIHFYHLWLGGAWKPIAAEHFAFLRDHGFSGSVQVGLVGSPEARLEAEAWLDRQWNYGIAISADEGFEEITLNALHRFAQTVPADTPILYAHNKGAFHAVPEQRWWRQAMMEHLVGDIGRRLPELEDHDVSCWHWLPVGIVSPNGVVFQNAMAGGNFWWARAGYIRQLPPLPQLDESTRIEAEIWLEKRSPKVAAKSNDWPKVEVLYKWVADGTGMAGRGRWEPIH